MVVGSLCFFSSIRRPPSYTLFPDRTRCRPCCWERGRKAGRGRGGQLGRRRGGGEGGRGERAVERCRGEDSEGRQRWERQNIHKRQGRQEEKEGEGVVCRKQIHTSAVEMSAQAYLSTPQPSHCVQSCRGHTCTSPQSSHTPVPDTETALHTHLCLHQRAGREGC